MRSIHLMTLDGTRKTLLTFLFAMTLAGPLTAEVEILPPEFTLFGKTSGEYVAEWMQHIIPLSTNGDYLLPKSVPSENDPVYFLQRPLFGTPPPGVQTYFVPSDVHVWFPIVFFWGDNVDTFPPFTVEELCDGLNSIVDVISGVHATIDGVAFTNLQAYRTKSPVFSLFFPTSDNFYSVILRHPLEGIVDPVVAGGYFLMLKPLPAGLHDVRIGATIGGPNNFSFERHFQIHSLTLAEQVARQIEEVGAMVSLSSLGSHRQQSLQASLDGAKASFENQNLWAGIGQLRAFQHKVRAQVARADAALGEELIRGAQQIINKVDTE